MDASASIPDDEGMTREEAIANYRAKRATWLLACEREDAAFMRWFKKAREGDTTNAAGAARAANTTSYASAEMYSAQSALYALDIDPWDIDDKDGVERTPVGR